MAEASGYISTPIKNLLKTFSSRLQLSSFFTLFIVLSTKEQHVEISCPSPNALPLVYQPSGFVDGASQPLIPKTKRNQSQSPEATI